MNSKVDLEGNFPCEMRFGSFHPEKWNFRVHLTPSFLVRDSHSEISVNLECVSLVVREKFRNETVAIFRRVRRFRSQKISFHFCVRNGSY